MSGSVPAPDELRHRLSWVYAAALDQASAPSDPDAHDPGRWIRIQRIVHELVDVSELAPEHFLALAGLRGSANPDTEHAVAVTVLVLAFGRWAGLSRGQRAELGLVALHYDPDWRDENPPPREVTAVRHLANTGRFDPEAQRVVMLIREARQAHGDAGGPPRPLAQALFIASDLDALTRGVGGAAPLAMSDAAQALRDDSAGRYDPVVLGAFLKMLGLGDEAKRGQALGALKLKRLQPS